MIEDQPPSQPPGLARLKPCHWWRSRRVLLALVFLSLISILLGLGLYCRARSRTASPPGTPRRAPPPCLSSACQRAAMRLSAAADPFAQPCDYFLSSCWAEDPAVATRGRQRGEELTQGKAGLEERAPRNERHGRVVHLGRVTDAPTNMDTLPARLSDKQTALLRVLREILESQDRPSSIDSAERKVRRFYRSCMDTGTREKIGPQPVLKLIVKLGGWAVSGEWNHTDFNVILSLLMKEYATFPFFSVYVGKNPYDSNSSAHNKYIQIDQPEFHIPVEWDSKEQKSTLNVPTVLLLLSFHLRLLVLLGVPSSSTNAHTGMFLQLVSELILAASPLTHRRQKQLLYRRMTLRELQAAAPAIDWLGCLRATFHPIPVSQSDVVLLHNLPYIMHMSKTIRRWQRNPEMTESGSLHTFMILSLLHKVIPALNSKFAEIQRDLSIGLGDRLEVIPHWKKCVLETDKGFDTVLIALLKERVGEKEAEELIEDVYSSLMSTLSTLKLRDEELRSSIVNRVGSLTPRLSISKTILSQEKIDQQYSEVAISEDDYFSNYLQSLSLQQKKRRAKLFSQMAALDILSLTPSFSSEEIYIPLGMFIPPAFHSSYPRAVNYGVLGTLMAQEILYLLLPDIQSQSEAPREVSDCVWAHYLRLTESVRGTDPPRLTPAQQRAVWVQHTALHVALQAYKQSLLKYRGDTSLSGLSHTRLFLASFAQNNCNSDPTKERLPFEPFFLVTVICMKSDLCPQPMTCTHNSHKGFLQEC